MEGSVSHGSSSSVVDIMVVAEATVELRTGQYGSVIGRAEAEAC
jgi:hypothetical protein